MPVIPTGFTRFDLREGQHELMVLPRDTHETYVLLTTPSVRAFVSGNVPMTTMPSADFCAAIGRTYERLSPDAPDTTQISRGKFDRLRRTPAESTETELDGYGLRGHRPARPPETASYPVLVHRATTVAPFTLPPWLRSPFRPRLAAVALALRQHFTSIRLCRGLAPPGYRTCSAHLLSSTPSALFLRTTTWSLLRRR